MEKNLLSVDWDYFFPSIDMFDWGRREDKFTAFFFEVAWEMRAYNRLYHETFGKFSKNDSRTIRDYLQLEYKRVAYFWKKTCSKLPKKLVITESHADMNTLAQAYPSCVVWNFDAHHDTGYSNYVEPACDNWAFFLDKEGWLREYHLVYPPYRKKNPEMKSRVKVDIHYKMPKKLPYFDYVFICRSSAWTPSWSDAHWMGYMVNYWKERSEDLWRRKLALEYSLEPRKFNNEVAKEYKKHTDDAMKKMNPNIDICG